MGRIFKVVIIELGDSAGIDTAIGNFISQTVLNLLQNYIRVPITFINIIDIIETYFKQVN